MSPSPTPEERNPYAPSADWKPGQDTFTSQAAGIWAEGFAAGRAAERAATEDMRAAITRALEAWDATAYVGGPSEKEAWDVMWEQLGPYRIEQAARSVSSAPTTEDTDE